MSEDILPPSLPVASIEWGVADRTQVDESATSGDIQTSEIYGSRKMRVRFDFRSLSRRAGTLQTFRAFLARLQARKGRTWLTDPSHVQRGSFPALDLLANNEFSDGSTGWSASAGTAIAVTNAVLRATRIASSASFGYEKAATGTAYTPYGFRALLRGGLGGSAYRVSLTDGTDFPTDTTDAAGLRSAAGVFAGTSLTVLGYENTSSGIAGDYFECPWNSLSRCALVDAGPNRLAYSEQINQSGSWTVSGVTITSNSATAPDGSSTTDSLVETATTSAHYVSQNETVASSVSDFFFGCALKIGATRTWGSLAIAELTGNHAAFAYFNLSTGALGNTGVSGANWANVRSFIVDMGNGWWYCAIVARKVNAATTIQTQILGATSNGGGAYLGTPAAYYYAWRPTLSTSAVPGRLVLTAASDIPSGATQTGVGIYVKGLPVSTAGLALEGDQVQIGRYLRVVTAPLNSDAAGRGYLQLSEPIPSGVADNAAIYFNRPAGRFVLISSDPGVEMEPGVFGGASLEFIEG